MSSIITGTTINEIRRQLLKLALQSREKGESYLRKPPIAHNLREAAYLLTEAERYEVWAARLSGDVTPKTALAQATECLVAVGDGIFGQSEIERRIVLSFIRNLVYIIND